MFCPIAFNLWAIHWNPWAFDLNFIAHLTSDLDWIPAGTRPIFGYRWTAGGLKPWPCLGKKNPQIHTLYMFRTTPSIVLACLGQDECLLVLKPFEVSFAVSLLLRTPFRKVIPGETFKWNQFQVGDSVLTCTRLFINQKASCSGSTTCRGFQLRDTLTLVP